jgi:hypothetical protein
VVVLGFGASSPTGISVLWPGGKRAERSLTAVIEEIELSID